KCREVLTAPIAARPPPRSAIPVPQVKTAASTPPTAIRPSTAPATTEKGRPGAGTPSPATIGTTAMLLLRTPTLLVGLGGVAVGLLVGVIVTLSLVRGGQPKVTVAVLPEGKQADSDVP